VLDSTCSARTSARAGLEGYLLTGRHGLFNCYEACRSHHRLDVQPARQVAEGLR